MDAGLTEHGLSGDRRRSKRSETVSQSTGSVLLSDGNDHIGSSRDHSSSSGGEASRGLALEVAELVSCDPDTSLVVCDAFLYEPEEREETLGTLAFVLEALQTPVSDSAGEDPRSKLQLFDRIATVLRDEYYRVPSRDALASFEAALTSVNELLADMARQSADVVMSLQAAVVAAQQRTLHVSRVGSASVFLARHGHLTDVSEDLADPRARNPKAAFTNIASGTVSEHDALILTTPRFIRLIPRDRLASFVAGKSPQDVVRYLRELLLENEEEKTMFATLFLRFVRAPLAPPAPHREFRLSGQPSIAGAPLPPPAPAAPAQRPRVVPRPPLQLTKSWFRRTVVFTRRGVVLLVRFVIRRLIPAMSRAGTASAIATQRAAARTSLGARQWYARARGAAPGALGRRDALPHPLMVGGRLRRLPTEARRMVQAWPTSTKVFAFLTVVLALLFAGSLWLLRQKKIEEAAIRQASEQLQYAQVKKDAAEAALIYDNTDEARRLLQEARESLAQVEKTPYYASTVESLRATLQGNEDRLEGIVRVAEPLRVGDFGGVAPDGRVTGLAQIGNTLFGFAPETNAIFRLATDSGEVSVVSQSSQGVGYFRHVTALGAEQMLLLATDSPGLALFDTARGDLVKQEVDPLPEGAKHIRGLATFGSRLYLLFPEQRQIFGYSKTLAGYSGGAPWLTDPSIPVDRATALGVDGYMYLLMEDGKIVKLLKGAPVEFRQSELATPLHHPTKLVINETLKFLYVLDPPQKRVVVYDTTGKLSRQFLFPNAQDLRDMSVAGRDETLFVLDGTAVYKVALK